MAPRRGTGPARGQAQGGCGGDHPRLDLRSQPHSALTCKRAAHLQHPLQIRKGPALLLFKAEVSQRLHRNVPTIH